MYNSGGIKLIVLNQVMFVSAFSDALLDYLNRYVLSIKFMALQVLQEWWLFVGTFG